MAHEMGFAVRLWGVNGVYQKTGSGRYTGSERRRRGKGRTKKKKKKKGKKKKK
jgi:hypothetical protein